jgi:5'-nucleotidase/UDP-sugar diphosphatase
MSFRTNVRNLDILIILVIKISPFGRNDNKMNCDTVFNVGRQDTQSRKNSQEIKLQIFTNYNQYIKIYPIYVDTISEVVISLQDVYLIDQRSIDPDKHNASGYFMKILSRILILLSFLILSCPPPLFSGQPDAVDITILHVNDTHGRILPYMEKSVSKKEPVSGAAYLARMVQEERLSNPEGTLLLSAGDMFQGTPVSNLFKGQAVIEVMNYLRFDAMAIGNHEFDWGMDAFENLLVSSRFPYLSANIKDHCGYYLTGVKPYIMVFKKNVKIAIIGVTTPEVIYNTYPGIIQGCKVYRPEEILPGLIKKVKGEGAHMIIVLSHLGLDADKELAQRVPGIHVIVGGHSHSAIKRPVVIGDTIILQTGSHGLYLGVFELSIDTDTGKIVRYKENRVLKKVLAGLDKPYDEAVAGIVNKYYDQIKEKFTQVVGETLVDLKRRYQRESNIGNLVCDTMRKEANADIAFLNSGGIRTDIPKGKITLEQVFTLLPFDNNLVTMNLTGTQILKILEYNAKMEQGFLQASGIKIRYDVSEPAGSRVKEVSIGDTPLIKGKTYTVATIDFLAAGGDAFTTFKEGKNILYGISLRDLFVSYLKKHSPVAPRIEGRIIVNTEREASKFHDKRMDLPRVNLFDLQPQLHSIF